MSTDSSQAEQQPPAPVALAVARTTDEPELNSLAASAAAAAESYFIGNISGIEWGGHPDIRY